MRNVLDTDDPSVHTPALAWSTIKQTTYLTRWLNILLFPFCGILITLCLYGLNIISILSIFFTAFFWIDCLLWQVCIWIYMKSRRQKGSQGREHGEGAADCASERTMGGGTAQEQEPIGSVIITGCGRRAQRSLSCASQISRPTTDITSEQSHPSL